MCLRDVTWDLEREEIANGPKNHFASHDLKNLPYFAIICFFSHGVSSFLLLLVLSELSHINSIFGRRYLVNFFSLIRGR